MTDITPADPDLPLQRKTVGSGLLYSVLAVLIVLFSIGALPQIDNLFTSLDTTLRGDNDSIVRFILQFLPIALVGLVVFGLVYALLGYFYRQRRAA